MKSFMSLEMSTHIIYQNLWAKIYSIGHHWNKSLESVSLCPSLSRSFILSRVASLLKGTQDEKDYAILSYFCLSVVIGVSEGLSQGGPTSFIPPNYLSILLPPLYQYEMILSYLVKPHDTTQHTKKNYRL